MNRIAYVCAAATFLAVACGDGGPSVLEAGPVEGLVDAAPARLDVAGLAEERGIDGGGCVTAVRVLPGGSDVGGARWLVTFVLAKEPADDVPLAAALGDEACVVLRDTELDRVNAALGAVRPGAVDVTYVAPSGRRWLGP